MRFRRGFMLGDGTGAGKGRQVAGIILDNWMQGRRKAVWISKSDKLIEDAQRDWSALGMERLLVTPLSRFPQGTPIRSTEGILFTTYATLRSDDRGEKLSRVKQIVEWLGSDFDGVIIFDESHAMQNAAGGKGERGDQRRLAAGPRGAAAAARPARMPASSMSRRPARPPSTISPMPSGSASGAARISRSRPAPSSSRRSRTAASRRWRCWRATCGRSASTPPARSPMTASNTSWSSTSSPPSSVRIYDAYAGAFAIIHNNLDAAMQAANITGSERHAEPAGQVGRALGLRERQAALLRPSAHRDEDADPDPLDRARSRGRPCRRHPDRLDRRSADGTAAGRDPDRGMERRPRRHHAARICPRLSRPFLPGAALRAVHRQRGQSLVSRPVFRDGQPVESREAVARRDELIEQLASLPPVPGALDQIVQRFGTDMVAEVTGRSRRIVRKERRASLVESRAGVANLAETQAFMDDAEAHPRLLRRRRHRAQLSRRLSARNQRLRVHYLLEPGWKADAAIQGLGRTNRTNQAQPPLFRPIATDVKAEKRFLSTIARRLDTLGAITRGQRQTGGQGLFRPEDNLESALCPRCAAPALSAARARQGRGLLARRFEDATGLKLMDANGIKDELPPITTFLNRLLALTIDLQGILFAAFEQLADRADRRRHRLGHL